MTALVATVAVSALAVGFLAGYGLAALTEAVLA